VTHIDPEVLEEALDFVQWAMHDAGCVGGIPEYRCKCGLRDLRFKLGMTPEPEWDNSHEQPRPTKDGER